MNSPAEESFRASPTAEMSDKSLCGSSRVDRNLPRRCPLALCSLETMQAEHRIDCGGRVHIRAKLGTSNTHEYIGKPYAEPHPPYIGRIYRAEQAPRFVGRAAD